MSPACSGASGFGSGFVEPMGKDGLGMRRGPAVGQHLFQTRVVRMQAEEKFAYIAPRLDPMTLRTGEDRTQHGRPRTRCFAAQEEPILSANGLVPKRSFAHVVVDGQTASVRYSQRVEIKRDVARNLGDLKAWRARLCGQIKAPAENGAADHPADATGRANALKRLNAHISVWASSPPG